MLRAQPYGRSPLQEVNPTGALCFHALQKGPKRTPAP